MLTKVLSIEETYCYNSFRGDNYMNDPQKEFGQYLRQIRKLAGLSIRQLEEKSGVSNAYLSQIETGKRGIPSSDVIKKIHGPLGVSFEDLLEKAGHITSEVRSTVLPGSPVILDTNVLEEMISNAVDVFKGSITENNKLKNEYRDFLIEGLKSTFPNTPIQDLETFLNNPDFINLMFDNLTLDEKISFLNIIIQDYLERGIDPSVLLNGNKEKEDDQDTITINTTLKVPVLGHIAAGVPIFANEHIEEWTEIPNLWNLKEGNVFVLKVKGDSMIGSRIFDGDRVIVKIQPDVENGEIAVINVNGDEATLKRVKKTENGQVILYPDNPKYDPQFITNENARIVGKVIQVMFEP